MKYDESQDEVGVTIANTTFKSKGGIWLPSPRAHLHTARGSLFSAAADTKCIAGERSSLQPTAWSQKKKNKNTQIYESEIKRIG